VTDLILDRIIGALEDNGLNMVGLRPRLETEVNDGLREAGAGTATAFEFELSDFKFITVNGGRALRLTLTWKFSHPQYGLLGASTEGCMIVKQRDGAFRFSPPVSKFAPHQSKVLTVFTQDLHDAVVARVANWKTAKGVSYFDYLSTREESSAQLPGDVDPELPLEISEEKAS
jgi:hypothetical protein